MAVGQFRIRDLELIVALHEEGNMTQAVEIIQVFRRAIQEAHETKHNELHKLSRGVGILSALFHRDAARCRTALVPESYC